MSNNTTTIIVKNTTGLDVTWGGLIYLANSEYLIEDVDRLRLLSDPIFYAAALSGDAKISDGNYDLPRRVGIGLLQNNEIILQEYYTLTQEDDILVGNGKILQLHDEKWDLEDDFE